MAATIDSDFDFVFTIILFIGILTIPALVHFMYRNHDHPGETQDFNSPHGGPRSRQSARRRRRKYTKEGDFERHPNKYQNRPKPAETAAIGSRTMTDPQTGQSKIENSVTHATYPNFTMTHSKSDFTTGLYLITKLAKTLANLAANFTSSLTKSAANFVSSLLKEIICIIYNAPYYYEIFIQDFLCTVVYSILWLANFATRETLNELTSGLTQKQRQKVTGTIVWAVHILTMSITTTIIAMFFYSMAIVTLNGAIGMLIGGHWPEIPITYLALKWYATAFFAIHYHYNQDFNKWITSKTILIFIDHYKIHHFIYTAHRAACASILLAIEVCNISDLVANVILNFPSFAVKTTKLASTVSILTIQFTMLQSIEALIQIQNLFRAEATQGKSAPSGGGRFRSLDPVIASVGLVLRQPVVFTKSLLQHGFYKLEDLAIEAKTNYDTKRFTHFWVRFHPMYTSSFAQDDPANMPEPHAAMMSWQSEGGEYGMQTPAHKLRGSEI